MNNELDNDALLKLTGKAFVEHSRDLIEKLALGPVSVDFFESTFDEVSNHYSQYGINYRLIVENFGEKLDQYLGADRKKVVNWLETSNPSLGDAKPIELLFVGCGQELTEFVEKLIKSKNNTQGE